MPKAVRQTASTADDRTIAVIILSTTIDVKPKEIGSKEETS